jgi:hypothetical protein
MDVSHFGLFDLTAGRPRWTHRAPAIPACIANDNAIFRGPGGGKAAHRRPRPATRSPFRLVWRRDQEPGPA